MERLCPPFHHFPIDDDLADPGQARQLEHRIEEDTLHDRTQAAGPRLAGDRLLGDAAHRLFGQFEADILHLEEPLVLFDERVLRLHQDVDESILVEVVERCDDRQPADEFRDQSEFEQVFRLEILEDLAGFALVGSVHFGAETNRGALAALGDELFEPGERAAADEQDVGGVDLQELLLRMLAAALRGTEAMVPSMILSNACCTPSPDTSRVIEGLSDLREILSTSSI